MTQFDETMPSPPSPSPEYMQLQKISTQIDTTLSEFNVIQQHIHDMIALICGMKWYQHACHTKLSYVQWKEILKNASQLTYTCGGVDEALMRHLFSLDAIMGDDSIRTIRRACVHRIKENITLVEKYMKYMYRAQYWIKKWIKHEDEEIQMETETLTTTTTEPTVTKPETSPSIKPATKPMPPSTKSSTLRAPTTKPRSNSTSFRKPHAPIKSRSNSQSPLQSSRSLTTSPSTKATKLTKSPTLKPSTTKSPVRSATLSSKSPLSKSLIISPASQSALDSPTLRTRHIAPQPLPHTPTPSSPRFNVSHHATHITITALLPDVPRDSLDVTIRGHILRITGRFMGESFLREMELPETCDVDALDAAWEEETDTLKIRVPIVKKVKPQPQPQPHPQPVRTQTRPQPSRSQSRYLEDQEMDDDADDTYHSHPYYSQPMNYSSRCAPSYVHPSYPSYARRPLYAAPPRNMFGSPFGRFW